MTRWYLDVFLLNLALFMGNHIARISVISGCKKQSRNSFDKLLNENINSVLNLGFR